MAVAADSPEELQRNVDAAVAAGKDVRVVTITTTAGIIRYSPYAQIVRTNAAVIVHAYGRVHIYRLADARISYPPGTPFAVANLPEVSAPLIDKAVLANERSDPALQSDHRSLCGNCFLVFVRRNGVKAADPWPTAKDPWQTNPDYVFWKPGLDSASASRSPQFGSHWDPLCYVSTPCGVYDCPPIYGSCVYMPLPPGLPGPSPILGSACGSSMVVNPPNPPIFPGQRFITALDGQGGLFFTNGVASWTANMSVAYFDNHGALLESHSASKSGGRTSDYQILYAPYSNALTYYQTRIPFNFYDTEHSAFSPNSQSFALTATAKC